MSADWDTEVVIVGAGPAGLLLAAELRRAGVATTVLERHAERPGFCRGFTLNARALDLLARRGLDAPFLAEGWQVPQAAFSGLPVTLDLTGARTDHPYTLGIPQTRVEEVLEAHALELGADLRRGWELRALRQDADAVTATAATPDGERVLRAGYLVGCDGGRSTVRKQAGIAFPGTPATRFSLLGDVESADPDGLPLGVTTGPGGAVLVIPRPGYVRVVVDDPEPPEDRDTPVTLERLRSAVDAALGRRVELRAPRWLTRFGDAARLAERYRTGRVLLAGDAAHVHPPAGAIGVNAALDDAFNLGWKLAAAVRGTAPAHLLDTYHDERHAAGVRLLASTRAQALLGTAGDGLRPVADLLTRLAEHPDGNRALAEVVTGLDTRYPAPAAPEHPWLGRMAPDLVLGTGTRLAQLLAPGRGVLLDLGDGTAAERAAGWADRVGIVTDRCPDHPDLRALLLRPDGHTAWVGVVGEQADGLPRALEHWYGPARSGVLATG
ncbi:2-polyprenyl-6-methoxyphenol hydroxylase-like FAD-dependent oxidoreductase [Saccharothrix coeruleofusca]|uniref:FAD-dependent monooxygenase n=1 Tax=Saccharothrix coeruleofusca TaxID=33919 RepID=UPI001AE0EC94|nr:FAD-dependent monooxygenase [Saccharothrix coeruleofusca]MBP2336915.1 2-polyprenyl-6-methoxyphenol hydroxylase-like FAD-dependent oxidoreductase [Saccharothrix coeruleofusca]